MASYPTFKDLKVQNAEPEAFKKDAIALVMKVRDDWKSFDNLKTKIFSDGISNSLIGVYNNGKKDNMVLVRVYGNNTDKFIDREAELRNMELFNAHGCGSKIYAKFANGIAYGLIPGSVVSKEQVREARIAKLIAETMAKVTDVRFSAQFFSYTNVLSNW